MTLPEKERGAPACSPWCMVCGQQLMLERGPTGDSRKEDRKAFACLRQRSISLIFKSVCFIC